MQLSAHSKRLLTACVTLLAPASAVLFGGWVLFAILAAFCALSLWEFYTLFWPTGKRTQTKAAGALLGLGILLALSLGSTTWALLALLAAFWGGNLAFLADFGKRGEQASYLDGMVFFAGLLYLPVTLHFFLFMNPMEVVLVIGGVICSDTAAFYAGTLWGKRRIWPRVSPKKSWVGSFASLGACMAFVTGVGVLAGHAPWWAYAYLGLALNLAAQLGDFFESALKRKLGIKDSGSILPGHGGLMDRLDSMLLALPVYAAAVALFPELMPAPGFEQLLPAMAAH
ncbi:MAG: phosphatidate cytidylyltransferase [Desulfovibrionaceae bacterium]